MDSVEVAIFPGDLDGKESTCNAGFNAWVWKIPWRREWQPTPVFLPGESHGQGSLAGYSPWGLKESDMTEALKHCIEGKGKSVRGDGDTKS